MTDNNNKISNFLDAAERYGECATHMVVAIVAIPKNDLAYDLFLAVSDDPTHSVVEFLPDGWGIASEYISDTVPGVSEDVLDLLHHHFAGRPVTVEECFLQEKNEHASGIRLTYYLRPPGFRPVCRIPCMSLIEDMDDTEDDDPSAYTIY